MPPIREQAVERIRRDHEYMIGLAQRIKDACTQGNDIDNCNGCRPDQRQVCHGNIEHLIRAFIEATQKHHLIESLLMEESVPRPHRTAHRQAHVELTGRMKAIRVAFSADGNCMKAIEGIDDVLGTMQAHFEEYDQQLESYLLAPA
ncbi:MAG: hypothetical protein A2045_09930 [Rhodocyclales bacterium GWA2_65_20]|nr:MAG: hypothetical protein A2045_09930 [Rhodocyclales bacterium GWA2_65_20]